MTKYFYIILICLAVNGCLNDSSNQTKTNSHQVLDNKLHDTVYVKKWLSKVITDYVNNEDEKVADKKLQEALTKDYYDYKIDAITLEYSAMSIEDFHNKWKSKYDTRYVGKGGFFTSVMDNGNVKVTTCRFLKNYGDTILIFHTNVHDIRWNSDYKFDIKIIYKDNKLLIDDVKELKPDK